MSRQLRENVRSVCASMAAGQSKELCSTGDRQHGVTPLPQLFERVAHDMPDNLLQYCFVGKLRPVPSRGLATPSENGRGKFNLHVIHRDRLIVEDTVCTSVIQIESAFRESRDPVHSKGRDGLAARYPQHCRLKKRPKFEIHGSTAVDE